MSSYHNALDIIDFFDDEVAATSKHGTSRLVHNNGHIFELRPSDSMVGCVEVGLKNGPTHLDNITLKSDSTHSTTSASDISEGGESASDTTTADTDTDDDNASHDSDKDQFQLQMAKNSFDQGVAFWSAGEYDLCMVEFRRSVELRESILGKYHEDTYKAYYWIATIYWHKGEHQKALEMFCHCFQIMYRLNDGDVGRCAISSGWIDKALDALHLRDNEMDKYWSLLKSAVENEKQGDEHYEKKLYKFANQEYKLALTKHQQRRSFLIKHSPLAARLGKQPESQPELAYLHLKVGDSYSHQDMFERSMMSYRKALSVYIIRFGSYSTYTKTAMKHLRRAASRFGFGDKLIQQYLDGVEKSVFHETKGDLLVSRKKVHAAAHEFEQALQLEESSAVGRLQMPSASMYCKLGSIFADQEQFDKALPMFCKALGIYETLSNSKTQQDAANTMKFIKKLLVRQAKMKSAARGASSSLVATASAITMTTTMISVDQASSHVKVAETAKPAEKVI
mmetsp:Transcript_7445/g.21793  ORF Transcript_7445/g.21793 Transcript_7445/m.21793 type:complete len:509 (-) Transcript_7445:183-1709(-)